MNGGFTRKVKRLHRNLDDIVDEGFETGDNIHNDDITKEGDSLTKDKVRKENTKTNSKSLQMGGS